MKLASAADFLALGLDLDRWPGWRTHSKKTNSDRFKKIYGAYPRVISLEEAARDDTIFMLSLDTTICPVNEPCPWSKSSSHKLRGNAVLTNEIVLQISQSKLAWRTSPIPAGKQNYVTFFGQDHK
eukprot:15365401-Ditylum_brightwellii.AAC.1